jgi:signal transduction histidine kinase
MSIVKEIVELHGGHIEIDEQSRRRHHGDDLAAAAGGIAMKPRLPLARRRKAHEAHPDR